jgi:hypothetical protein
MLLSMDLLVGETLPNAISGLSFCSGAITALFFWMAIPSRGFNLMVFFGVSII